MTITKWEQDGMPIAERGRRGKPSLYRLVDVDAWRQQREEKATNTGVASVSLERARRDRAQAVLAEQMARIRARDWLPREEVARQLQEEIDAAKAKLLSWESTLAHRLYRAAVNEKLPGVERVLHVAVREVLLELSTMEPTSQVAATAT